VVLHLDGLKAFVAAPEAEDRKMRNVHTTGTRNDEGKAAGGS
jgi:hypothetical protein